MLTWVLTLMLLQFLFLGLTYFLGSVFFLLWNLSVLLMGFRIYSFCGPEAYLRFFSVSPMWLDFSSCCLLVSSPRSFFLGVSSAPRSVQWTFYAILLGLVYSLMMLLLSVVSAPAPFSSFPVSLREGFTPMTKDELVKPIHFTNPWLDWFFGDLARRPRLVKMPSCFLGPVDVYSRFPVFTSFPEQVVVEGPEAYPQVPEAYRTGPVIVYPEGYFSKGSQGEGAQLAITYPSPQLAITWPAPLLAIELPRSQVVMDPMSYHYPLARNPVSMPLVLPGLPTILGSPDQLVEMAYLGKKLECSWELSSIEEYHLVFSDIRRYPWIYEGLDLNPTVKVYHDYLFVSSSELQQNKLDLWLAFHSGTVASYFQESVEVLRDEGSRADTELFLAGYTPLEQAILAHYVPELSAAHAYLSNFDPIKSLRALALHYIGETPLTDETRVAFLIAEYPDTDTVGKYRKLITEGILARQAEAPVPVGPDFMSAVEQDFMSNKVSTSFDSEHIARLYPTTPYRSLPTRGPMYRVTNFVYSFFE